MKSLFSLTENQHIIRRISELTPQATHRWGQMTVAQMLAHVQAPMLIAFGELKIKRDLLGILLGKLLKKNLLEQEIFKKSSAGFNPILFINESDFEIEKTKLIALIQRFVKDGKEALTRVPHPIFGKMNLQEWDLLQWKLLDHHLRQFGH